MATAITRIPLALRECASSTGWERAGRLWTITVGQFGVCIDLDRVAVLGCLPLEGRARIGRDLLALAHRGNERGGVVVIVHGHDGPTATLGAPSTKSRGRRTSRCSPYKTSAT